MEENEKEYFPYGDNFSPEVIILRNEGALRVLEILEAQGKAPAEHWRGETLPLVVYIDEAVPANSPEASEWQQKLLALCRKFDLPVYYGKGFAYQDYEELDGYYVAGVDADVMVVGGESGGGLGVCLSPEEIARLIADEEYSGCPMSPGLIRRVRLVKRLKPGVDVRDAARALIEEIKEQVQQDETLNFHFLYRGTIEGVELSIMEYEEAKILCGMMQKLPVRTAYFHGSQSFDPSTDFIFDLSKVKPSIDVGDGHVVKTLSPEPVQAVWIGGAYGGDMLSIMIAAKALKGKRVAPGVRLSVSPCTADTYAMAAERGYLTDIMEAGGLVLNQCASPKEQARIGDDELMVSNDFHNEKGYAGGTIYLASTYKAIEAALTGVISLGRVKKMLAPVKALISEKKKEEPKAEAQQEISRGPAVLTGRVWKFGDDIDTDIIMPTQHLSYADWEEVKRHMFEPLRPELASQIREGDIIVAGNNFGCGSSREQAAEVIATSGIRCIIAKSFARIFFRNAINNGVLLIECPALPDQVEEGDTVEVVVNSHISHKGKTYPIPKMPENLYRLIEAGGLVKSVTHKN